MLVRMVFEAYILQIVPSVGQPLVGAATVARIFILEKTDTALDGFGKDP
jgi:hypothetical protein